MRTRFSDHWTFLKTAPGTSLESALLQLENFSEVELPHDWLIEDSTNLYEDGTGFYRKIFELQPEKDRVYSLFFEGVYMDTTVYANGVAVGEWKYGYSSFEMDITNFLKSGENEIVVEVRHLSPNSRWYSGAGIYRDVWFKDHFRTHIPENGIYIHSEETENGDYNLEITTKLCGIDGDRANEDLSLKYYLYDDAKNEVTEIIVPKAEKESRSQELISKPRLWDIDSPYLYSFVTELYKGDTLLQREDCRIGFRTIEADANKGFFLNHRSIKLNGVCEHHDLGALGAAFHKEAMRRKLAILKEMGVNALRTSHNMVAPAVVDLCDEMGVLLVSEAFDMWKRQKTTYDYARFYDEWHEKDVEAWVTRDRNHPCLMMFSIGNEIYDTHADEEGYETCKELRDLVEKFDPAKNAFITFGSNYMPWENTQKCAPLMDVVGYNYGEKYYDEHHAKYPDWIIYGSETASLVQSRGIYHFPLATGILAEDDEQCSALGNSPTSWGTPSFERCITYDRDRAYSLGQFLWSGFDYIGEPTPYHTKNSYFGQIDTAGFPKDGFYVWKGAWTDYKKSPMVHIFPYWDFNEGQMIDVRIASNAPLVELFLNGESMGVQSLDITPHSGTHVIADYRIAYTKGSLLAIAMDENGNEVARDEKRSFGDSKAITLKPDKREALANGRDLIFVEIGTLDADGNPVENAVDRVEVMVRGAGRLVGLDNGDSTDEDSYKGVSRRLFSGKLLAIIKTTYEAGDMEVCVKGEGLKEAKLVLKASRDFETKEDLSETDIYFDKNEEKPILLGKASEIPVRKIELYAPMGVKLCADKKEAEVLARILPQNATDTELIFRAVDENGVDTNLVTLETEGNKAIVHAMGDGKFYLRCMSKSGTKKIRVISSLEFEVSGIGQAYLNPYEFISGSLYKKSEGDVGTGNERGVAMARDGRSTVTFENIDFGAVGSDTVTLPIFALSGDPYQLIVRDKAGSVLGEFIYQKPSIWNTYQEETYVLNRRIKGIESLTFEAYAKYHIKGFSFKKLQKLFIPLSVLEASSVYGDSFRKLDDAIEEIGNNVTISFKEMIPDGKLPSGVCIEGRAPKGINSIHIQFLKEGEEKARALAEFPKCQEYQKMEFELKGVPSEFDEIAFVFMPGSCFDFRGFEFLK